MSTINPIFRGKINDGILTLKEKDKYENYLNTLLGDIELIIRKPKKTRSSQANKYYWGVVLKLISETTGEGSEDLHNHFAYKHLSLKGKSGKLHSRRSTASLTVLEFMEYIDKIILWAEQYLNISFPNPEEIEYDFEI